MEILSDPTPDTLAMPRFDDGAIDRLVRALGEVFRGAAWQRCAVHLTRDCMREADSWQLGRRVGGIVSQVFRGATPPP